MDDDERQAWRNVKMGIDTFEEEETRKRTSRGAQGESSWEENEEGSMSVSKTVRKTVSSSIFVEEEGMIKKRLTPEDRKREISQEPATLLPKSRDTINLKTRMKDGDTGMFMRGVNYNLNGGGGVKDMVRKFESLEGQRQDICLRTCQEYNFADTIRGQEADTVLASPLKRQRLTKLSPVGRLSPGRLPGATRSTRPPSSPSLRSASQARSKRWPPIGPIMEPRRTTPGRLTCGGTEKERTQESRPTASMSLGRGSESLSSQIWGTLARMESRGTPRGSSREGTRGRDSSALCSGGRNERLSAQVSRGTEKESTTGCTWGEGGPPQRSSWGSGGLSHQ
jgi:hypothetical protein